MKGIKTMIALLIIMFIACSCEYVCFWQIDHPDSAIEEFTEDMIEEYLDVDIDLTPFTGEEKQNLNLFKRSF